MRKKRQRCETLSILYITKPLQWSAHYSVSAVCFKTQNPKTLKVDISTLSPFVAHYCLFSHWHEVSWNKKWVMDHNLGPSTFFKCYTMERLTVVWIAAKNIGQFSNILTKHNTVNVPNSIAWSLEKRKKLNSFIHYRCINKRIPLSVNRLDAFQKIIWNHETFTLHDIIIPRWRRIFWKV